MEYIETCGDGYRVVAFLLWSANESLFFLRFYISEKVNCSFVLFTSAIRHRFVDNGQLRKRQEKKNSLLLFIWEIKRD